jgi:DNA-binding XRE family transcriptional regulator
MVKTLKKARALSKSYGTTRQHPVTPANAIKGARESMTDSQREQQVRQALTRYVRNKELPESLERLRYNLIVARVMSGMTQVEAAEKFGYSKSTQINLIESGQRKTPDDHKFIRQAAEIYAVSTDFLLGLSPHMEFDSKVQQQHALMRGVESVLSGISAEFATVMIEYTKQTQPVPNDFARVSSAADKVEIAVGVMRRHGLDEVRGSSLLATALEELDSACMGLRQKLKSYRSVEGYFDDVRSGKMQAIPFLRERYQPRHDPRQADLGWAEDQ